MKKKGNVSNCVKTQLYEKKIQASILKPTIGEMLGVVYATGTERTKNNIPCPPEVKNSEH